jgi:hypothetical protein
MRHTRPGALFMLRGASVHPRPRASPTRHPDLIAAPSAPEIIMSDVGSSARPTWSSPPSRSRANPRSDARGRPHRGAGGELPALTNPAAHVLVLCGRNADLRAQLDARDRVTALGWRDDVPLLMAAADVLLDNAGELSVIEALVANLPAVTYRPIPGHGRANATVLAEAGLAPWPTSPDGLAAVLDGIAATSPLSPWPATPEADVAAIVLELADAERQAVPAAQVGALRARAQKMR